MTTFGKRLETIRLTAKNGKRMSRTEFAALFELGATQLRNIEQGRNLSDDELSKILAIYPELGIVAFEPYVKEPTPLEQAETVAATREVQRIFGDLVALDEDEEDPDAEGLSVAPHPLETVPQLALVDPRRILDTSDGIRRFSNSEIQTFKRCRRKWWLAWYRRLRLRIEDPTGPRAIGNRVHRALAAWYVPDGQPRVDPRDALERAITEDWTGITAAAAGVIEISPELVKRFSEDTTLERLMIEGYLEWLAETGADAGLRVVASETYLEANVEADGRPVKLIARVDTRVVRESDGARLFVDHKTVGDLSTPVKTLNADEQMMHYHLLEWLNQLQEDGRAAGALYNMLRKVKRTARATPPFYGRVEVHHNDQELQSFMIATIATITEILHTAARLDRGEDPRAAAYKTWTKNCSWDCDFFQLCPMFDDDSRVDDMISTYYTEGDPLSYYRTDDQGKETGG